MGSEADHVHELATLALTGARARAWLSGPPSFPCAQGSGARRRRPRVLGGSELWSARCRAARKAQQKECNESLQALPTQCERWLQALKHRNTEIRCCNFEGLQRVASLPSA